MSESVAATTDSLADLQLRFGGRLVEQLGAQMYPSATATVAELISNAWDADARHVWIQMPFGDWENGEIVVIDDGLGMDHDDARDAYLLVGRNRRINGEQRSPGGRLVHGRKGIGKLAAFGTATVLELKTKRQGHQPVAFRLDYEKIRQQDPDQPYRVEESTDHAPLADPFTGQELEHGTRIRLTGLRLKRRLNKEQFVRSMSRRFALNDRDMKVFINDDTLRRFELDLDIRFPPDSVPPGVEVDGQWAIERLANGEEVRWWIGFTRTPLRGEAEQGVSVLVRGKLAQRPFKFERNTGGTTGQLGQEYLVGEVIADWIDDDDDADPDADYIQSNRDQLQLEDSHLDPFIEWGQRRLSWALNARNDLRSARNLERIRRIEPLDKMLVDFSERERSGLIRVADAVSRLPEVDDSELVRVMEAVVETREGETARALAEQISLEGFDADRFWLLAHQLAELDGRSAKSFVEARLETLRQLQDIPADSGLSQHVERVLKLNPGLVDPAWESFEADDMTVSSEIELGRAYAISQPNREDPIAIVLVAEGLVGVEQVERLKASIADGATVVPLIIVVPGEAAASVGDVPVRVTTWSEMLLRSELLHEGWLMVLGRRAERARRVDGL
jgi:hypothetical protein